MVIISNDLNEIKIKELIDNEVVEDLHLDYKACDALKKNDDKRNEISKDVSSFANSDGGIIIYGVVEQDNKPFKIDNGFNPGEISKEWIDQVINSKISPKIENVRIIPINLSNSSNLIYVIDIPKSNRSPHQSSDKRFYKRYNSRSVPMEEYEIRELYFRNIISQSEFRKLQAHVRDDIYKPLFSQLRKLNNKILSEPHPSRFYFDNDPSFIQHVVDESLYCHDFRIWNRMKNSGDWLDIYGIGDNDLLEILEKLVDNVIEYNSLSENFFREIGLYLQENVGSFDTGRSFSPNGWDDIKEEIFSNNPFLSKESKTIYYLKNSEKEKWKELNKLSDNELFLNLYNELMSKFSDNLEKTNELAEEIKNKTTELNEILKIKIKNTYPK